MEGTESNYGGNGMKRGIAALLLLVMVLTAGCAGTNASGQEAERAASGETAPETTVQETTVPETTAPPVPRTETGTVQGDGIPLVLAVLRQGDPVEVLDCPDGTHARVRFGELEGIMERQLLQTADAGAYESWQGYARYKAKLFASYRLLGEPVQTLGLNTSVQVDGELDGCYLVRVGDTVGFLSKKDVSRNRIQTGGGGDGDGAPSGGQDGGDISLGVPSLRLLAEVTVNGGAQAKLDGAELTGTLLNRGDTVALVAETGFAPELEGYRLVYREDGSFAYVPADWVQPESGTPFESWEGFAGTGCHLFDSYILQGDPVKKLNINAKLTVLWEGDSVWLVQDGETVGYAAAGTVRTTRTQTTTGGNDGSGNGGGDWTPPAL